MSEANKRRAPRPAVDWDAIEPDWRAGIKTKKQMAEEYGVSRAAMDKHFAKAEVERDLTAKIQAKAEAMVTQAQVTRSVTQDHNRATEAEIVQANAEFVALKVQVQRDGAGEAVDLSMSHVRECAAMGNAIEDLAKLGEIMASSDENGKDRLGEVYRKVISFAGRVDAGKKAIESLRLSVELQRKVLRIKDDSSADDMAKKIGEGAAMSALDAYTRMCEGA